MSLFTSFFSRKPDAEDSGAGQTLPQKMNLEERMAYRREMLFEAIGFAMDSKGIAEESYRLRVSRTDKRGHAYAVMINLSNEFLHDARGSQVVLQEIGKTIVLTAGASGLLQVNGVYWSVLEHAVGFGTSSSDAPASLPPIAPEPQRAVKLAIEQRIYASDIAPLTA